MKSLINIPSAKVHLFRIIPIKNMYISKKQSYFLGMPLSNYITTH
jgi:hypothetical protein